MVSVMHLPETNIQYVGRIENLYFNIRSHSYPEVQID